MKIIDERGNKRTVKFGKLHHLDAFTAVGDDVDICVKEGKKHDK